MERSWLELIFTGVGMERSWLELMFTGTGTLANGDLSQQAKPNVVAQHFKSRPCRTSSLCHSLAMKTLIER